MAGLHALKAFRIRKSIVCYPLVTGNCGSVPAKVYIDGMALYSAKLSCRKPWPTSRFSLFWGTTMATSGPGQREVFCASTALTFRSPTRAASKAEASKLSLRIAKGSSAQEVDAAWSGFGTAHLG